MADGGPPAQKPPSAAPAPPAVPPASPRQPAAPPVQPVPQLNWSHFKPEFAGRPD